MSVGVAGLGQDKPGDLFGGCAVELGDGFKVLRVNATLA